MEVRVCQNIYNLSGDIFCERLFPELLLRNNSFDETITLYRFRDFTYKTKFKGFRPSLRIEMS